jgi:hypothetical protein
MPINFCCFKKISICLFTFSGYKIADTHIQNLSPGIIFSRENNFLFLQGWQKNLQDRVLQVLAVEFYRLSR